MGQPQLQVGMETLAKGGDGRYYVGDVLKIDDKKEKCFILFETGEEAWCSFTDIQNALVGGQDIICCLCRKGISQEPNEIVLCDLCGLGFHQLCHNPEIPVDVLEPDVEWVCRLCGIVSDTNLEEATSTSEHSYTAAKSVPKTFTYQVNKLQWDEHHLTNKENQYCYCGQPGVWYEEMVECRRCHQWFHQECIDGLPYSPVWGDRFQVFICSPCNNNQGEYLHRIEIGWNEVVHLSIFHLTMERHIKYFDVYETIVPWIVKNFHRFHLQKNVLNTPRSKIREVVLETLEADLKKFKSGREIKKRFTWWGLRERYPPVPPPMAQLPTGVVSDEMVATALSKGNSSKWQKSVDEAYPTIPFKMHKKRKASSDGTDLSGPKPKKPRKLSLNNKTTSKTDNTPTDSSNKTSEGGSNCLLTSDLKQILNNNNNNSPAKISLDHIIPRPTSYDGVDHPFKTILERNQELATTKLKERLLGSLCVTGALDGGSTSDSCAASDDTASQSDAAATATSATLPKIKRRKRGRPSKAEIQALEARMAAAIKMGIKDRNVIVSSAPGTPKHSERPPPAPSRPKNVVDKSTLDGMSEREVSMSHLRTSVNNYFGAANRLATGEGFRVLARRVTPEGRVQYLVEWEGGIIG